MKNDERRNFSISWLFNCAKMLATIACSAVLARGESVISRDAPHGKGCPTPTSSILQLSRLPIALFLVVCNWSPSFAAEIKWTHLSSKNGDLPMPGESTQQTGSLIADLDKDGIKEFVLAFRKVPRRWFGIGARQRGGIAS